LGRRRAYAGTPVETAAGDLESLKREAEAAAQNLERINARIAELETAPQSASGESETT
jgi:hypothetical protein